MPLIINEVEWGMGGPARVNQSWYGRDPNGPAPPGTPGRKVVVVRTVTVLPLSRHSLSSSRSHPFAVEFFKVLSLNLFSRCGDFDDICHAPEFLCVAHYA
jgi:hypothetical protein